MANKLKSLFVLFFYFFALCASAQNTLLSAEQKHEYCLGVATAHMSFISTLLQPDGDKLSLPQIKTEAMVMATNVSTLPDLGKKGAIAHLNYYETEHVVQMRTELKKMMTKLNLSREGLREFFVKNNKDFMTEKYKGCRSEVK